MVLAAWHWTVMVTQTARTLLMPRPSKIDEERWRAALALVIVETGMRNSRLEELHVGIFPTSAVGDYSDVKVVTPYGEIPWSRLSRLCDEEMKSLMIEVVNRVYTILMNPEPFKRLMGAARWNKPEPDPALMDVIARWEARQRGISDEEIWAKWPLDESKRPPPIRMEQRTAAYEAELDEPREHWSFEATPGSLRALAEAPVADAAWIAKAREALRLGAEEWERDRMTILDEEDAAYLRDET